VDERGDQLGDFLGWVRPRWHRDAVCREHPEVNFFPSLGEPSAPALAVCAGCLVSVECRAAAFDGNEQGIWAGTTGRSRRLAARAA
jgi:hypothetical protein